MDKVVEIKNVTKEFGAFRAVDGLNLDIYKGDVFGFLGPNGAGKSTTIRMMLSLVRPTSGQIKIFNLDLHNNRKKILRRIGSIVEKPDFYNYLSAETNLKLSANLFGVEADQKKIDAIIDLVGLNGRAKDKVKKYSHGMKQRLGLAQALLHDPEMIILDEPTTGLDPKGIIDLRNLINVLSKEKKITVFLSSHILSEIEIIASRMAIINKGKSIVSGNTSDLIHNDDILADIYCDNLENAIFLIKKKFNLACKITNDHLEINTSRNIIPEINALLVNNDIRIYQISSRGKLEDLFLRLTTDNHNV
jgi:ABC-2 type transport system ATP-binding protein